MRKALASLAAAVVLAGAYGVAPTAGATPDAVPPFLCRAFPFIC